MFSFQKNIEICFSFQTKSDEKSGKKTIFQTKSDEKSGKKTIFQTKSDEKSGKMTIFQTKSDRKDINGFWLILNWVK